MNGTIEITSILKNMIDLEKNFQAILTIISNYGLSIDEFEGLYLIFKKFEQEIDFDSFALLTIYATKKYQKIPQINYLKKTLQDFINRGLKTKYEILNFLFKTTKQKLGGYTEEPEWLKNFMENYE